MNLIQKLLGAKTPEDAGAEPQERIQVATCVLLLELAHADGEFHAMEETLIQNLLQQRFGLCGQATAELMDFARQERDASLDMYQFAREINRNFSIDEKLEILESLWRIVYADGVMDKYEEYLMRQLSSLLRLSHRQMIDAKLKVRDEVRAAR